MFIDFAEVAVPLGVRKTFAYSVPASLRTTIKIGARVLVPFGRKWITGIVVGAYGSPPAGAFRLRPVSEVLDAEPLIPPALVETALWIAHYYFAPPGEVLRAFLPVGTDFWGKQRVRLSGHTEQLLSGGLRPVGLSSEENQTLDVLAEEGAMNLEMLAERSGLRDATRWVESLAAGKWVELDTYRPRARVSEKARLGIRALATADTASEPLTEAQEKLLSLLDRGGAPVALEAVLRRAGSTRAVARCLEKKGLVEILPVKVERLPIDLSESIPRKTLVLTEAQQQVFDRLRDIMLLKEARRCLLHGVTGSGKTEIYLRLIEEALKLGGAALFLVPEIGLTPLLSRTVLSYFPGQVALMHSAMSPGERFDQWHRIRSGHARVVIGTRSAVFAPLEDLRLVIIDEEQDPSYKQDESPCYHAREVAWHRVCQCGGLLLMGSATPSVESFYAARIAREVDYFNLPERIEARPLPEVSIIDMGTEFARHGKKTAISNRFLHELDARLHRGEQSIILLNRRGYSRTLLCRSCGNVSTCPDCSVPMTYHQKEGRLICHYCGVEREVPVICTSCGGKYIYFIGIGTEQLEEILRRSLPKARIARVDRDTTRRRGALRRMLIDFDECKLDILVGTQILAKGHDFPNVTLVGVIEADAGLSFPDFRSAERTFQLLTQVSGRAGRGDTLGKVIIQSYHPGHYALEYSRRQDYAGFFEHEIEFRKILGYPPCKKLIQILVTHTDAAKGFKVAERIADCLRRLTKDLRVGEQMRILGPAAAPLEKLRGKYRIQVLMKVDPELDAAPTLRKAFEYLAEHKVSLKSIHVDVDPLSLM